MLRKIGAIIILLLLFVVPFLNWRVGAVLWMCAWLTYIFQSFGKFRISSGTSKKPDEDIE